MDLQYKYRGPVEKLWPRRLLDITTMTSYERQNGNMYGGVCEPKYSAVSYSWGRFALRPEEKDSAIIISNITWRVPGVNPDHFSVEDFSRMLSQTHVVTGNKFIWLDVACIDQEDDLVKMDEIRKTPGIFANASVAFVWLCRVPMHELRKSWDFWKKVLKHQYSDGGLINDLESILALEDAASIFLDDPWFSSLWSLQDEGIRKDAFFLSREGEVAETDMIPCNVHSIQLGLSIMSSTLSNNSRQRGSPNAQSQGIADRIKLRLDNAGVPQPGSNPNLLYIASTRRLASQRTDSIYAIMGLYNIQVGAAQDPSRQYTLSELEEQFAIALNRKSFFLGQLFVHLETPAPGQSWKIAQTARVPKGFDQWTPRHVTDDCVLDARPGAPAHVSANITSFESLVQYWKVRLEGLSDTKRNDQLLVVVDDYICQTERAIPTYDSKNSASWTATDFMHTQETVDWLLAKFGGCRLSVLMLGGLSFRAGLYEECFGLLILHDETDRSRCRRIGLCKWEGNDYFGNMGVSEEAKAVMPQFEQRYNGVMS